MINYITHYRSRGTKNLIDKFFNKIFWEEYFNNLSEKEKNKIRDITLSNGEGKLWAEEYYNENFQKLEDLESIKIGNMNSLEAEPIYEDIISFLKNQNETCTIIQIGSSSGRDLNLIRNYFPEHEYISTDINDEILDFQRLKYPYKNFKFYKVYAQEIDKVVDHFSLQNKKIIIFAIGTAQYMSPNELELFFKKISNFKKINLFLLEPVMISFLDDKRSSSYRHDISYNHDYKKYAQDHGVKISYSKIIKPYDKKHHIHKDTAHYYLKSIEENE